MLTFNNHNCKSVVDHIAARKQIHVSCSFKVTFDELTGHTIIEIIGRHTATETTITEALELPNVINVNVANYVLRGVTSQVHKRKKCHESGNSDIRSERNN